MTKINLARPHVGFASFFMLLSSVAEAGSLFRTLPDLLDREWKSHNIAAASFLGEGSLGLSAADRHEMLRRHLHERGLHPLLSVFAKPINFEERSYGKFSSDLGLRVREYVVLAGRFEVCKSTIRTVDNPNDSSHVLGLIPSVDAVYPSTEDSWPAPEEVSELAQAVMRDSGLSDIAIPLNAMSRCLYPLRGELEPVWKVNAIAGHLPYVLYVGASGVVEGNVLAFDATEKVKAFRYNSKDPSSLVDFTLEVNGDGYLTNSYFTTGFGNSTPRKKAPFNATQSDPNFGEQSTFAHVNRQFQFVSQYGYVWPNDIPKPLKVYTAYSAAGSGNAQYIPYNQTQGGPYIIIGPDSNPLELTNLTTDSDVVSHEFGHHVVYTSVRDIPQRSESLIIHEGLADAFTFYATGDNCLGESICPFPDDPDGWCQVKGRCLRTGDNTLKYRDEVYNAVPKAHIRGQLISGLFADLRRGNEIPVENLNKLLVGTVAYLPREASVKALVTALLDADFALFNQQYSGVIKRASAARNMGMEQLGISLTEIDGRAPEAAHSKKKEKDGFLGLCSIGAEPQNTSSSLVIVALLFVPLLTLLVPLPQRVLVRVRKNKK